MCIAGGIPFARFFMLGTADPSGSDCDFGSGALPHVDATSWTLSVHRSADLIFGANVRASPFAPFGCYRIGEARHPGPDSLVHFGTSNPSGLRRKELHACELGVEVWSFSETQLNGITQRSCTQQIKSIARQAHRDVRVYTGAPVQTRVNSTWAGTWSGVAVISDFPGRSLTLPSAGSEYASGRIMVTQHFIQDIPVTLATIYGYPRGPTWPDAHKLNNELLMAISNEVIIGGNGIRIVAGDFNEAEDQGAHFPVWTRYGWQNAQSFARDHLGWTPQNTSKGATEVDMLWLSPEALTLLRTVEVRDVFMEHSTVVVGLDFSQPEVSYLSWPMPSAIPWDKVKSTWQPAPMQDTCTEDSTSWFRQWGQHFEASLDGHVSGQPQMKLTTQQRGRGARTQPEMRQQAPPMARPSRDGELCLRSDFVGSSVRAWFKQLRRFQSLLHAMRANSPTVNAALYQAEVWTAIRRARGFHPSFSQWWCSARQFDHPDAPSRLPTSIPSLPQLEGMFLSFKSCFEAFESWHIRQRAKLLKAKHEHTLATLHMELKDKQKEQVDSFTLQPEFTVMAVDPGSKSVQLDRPPDPRGFSTWTLADAPCTIANIDQTVCEVTSEEAPEVMDPLTQHQFLSKTQDLHDELTALWKPRWNATPKLSDADWKRFLDFTQAFIPKVAFQVDDISLTAWKRGLRRFKPRAAVGVDGFSHLDLQQLPDSMTLQLLALLHKIEQGEAEWPKQLLFGKVACLAKRSNAVLPDHFRPVVIFAVIYRAWASLRSQTLLRQIAPLLDRFQAFGFLPQKETAMYWMGLQADLEQLSQAQGSLHGVCTDLQKAFNHIPRPQTAILAEHLGVPQRILRPWMSFLSSCTRSFQVRDTLSSAITSTVGMPEGDALSVYAMVQLDLAWRTYLMVFQPAVQSWSFVDNLTWTSPSTGETAAALVGTRTFFHLWNLELDDAKTYAWSTDRTAHKQLQGLGLQTVQSAMELGGLMSFNCRRRIGAQLQRAESLEPRWKKLKLSQAFLPQKPAALVTSFWPKAMHGACNAPFTPAQIGTLRSKAVKALGLNSGGANPMLRLTLSGTPLADPGYFQLNYIVTTFVRIARKHPDLQLRLKHFVDNFDGKPSHGPCCTLLGQFAMLGWHLEPPWFSDHDQVWHHLFRIDPRFLRTLLWEGWLQHVAFAVNHRRTMASLESLDPELVHWHVHKLSALDRSRLSALQCGSFMSSDIQSKFDPTKAPTCELCHVPNGQDHWMVCPRYEAFRDDADLCVGRPEPGTAWSTHLLPRRNPYSSALKLEFNLIKFCFDFLSFPSEGCQHLFTDGSFFDFGGKYHGIAAWGVFNHSTGAPVLAHHLGGLPQGIDRAELSALHGALRWALCTDAWIHVWSDSQYVVNGFHFLFANGSVPSHWDNQDLWEQVLCLLQGLTHLPGCTWVPSHLDPDLCDDCFSDWVQQGNDQADKLAVEHNLQRSSAFWNLLRSSMGWCETGRLQFQWLQKFYFGIADADLALDPPAPSSLPPEVLPDPLERLNSMIPEDWLHFVSNFNFGAKALPTQFHADVLGSLLGFEDDVAVGSFRVLTFLELALALAIVQPIPFPFWHAQGECWTVKPLSNHYVRPTVAVLVSQIRVAVLGLADRFDFRDRCVSSFMKPSLGLHKPMGGIKVFVGSLWPRIEAATLAFCHSRPIRRACDLARPLPLST